jgi:hypothetical protein
VKVDQVIAYYLQRPSAWGEPNCWNSCGRLRTRLRMDVPFLLDLIRP